MMHFLLAIATALSCRHDIARTDTECCRAERPDDRRRPPATWPICDVATAARRALDGIDGPFVF